MSSNVYPFNPRAGLTSADVARDVCRLTNERNARLAARCEPAAWLAAIAVGLLLALAVYVAWQPCESMSLCMAVAGMPGRWGASRAQERGWAEGAATPAAAATLDKVEPAAPVAQEPETPGGRALFETLQALQENAWQRGRESMERQAYVEGARAGRLAGIAIGLVLGVGGMALGLHFGWVR